MIGNPTDGQLEIVLQSEMPKKGLRGLFSPELIETHLFLGAGAVVCKDGIHGFVDGTGDLSGTNLQFSIKPKAAKVIIDRTCQWRKD